MKKELATFGAGCFWGIEYVFSKMGLTTGVGYMGGKTKDPTYEDVCTDKTGHVEVVQVTYDPSKVKYEDLLKVFWENHNPTTMNRQGPDEGTQYRAVIFYHTPEQKKLAEKSKAEVQKKLAPKAVVTAIEPAQTFYKAEEYHQKYLEKHGRTFCHY